ncbi:NACHT, LRR and PYD domains-containing protein 12 [Labeo rohita]|uniref:NACHT, LRR and PYD domains-containing protein 12 n=1 Tax=Labeo rohita TaxID=84645 RepID=UPI0021E30C1F|nr:NACHT, LRR and PYD domains-containing protein 12 [Labeo rohita]
MDADESISSNPSVNWESKEGSAAYKVGFYDKKEEETHYPFQRTALPSCVSLKSDRSMAEPPKFSDKAEHFQASLLDKVEGSTVYHQFQRPASPLTSYASWKSDRSMAEPPKFSDKTGHLQPNLSEKVKDSTIYHQFQRPASPLPSNASLKSDRSMAEPPKFSDKTDHLKPSLPEKVEDCAVYHQFQRPASPLPSNASLKSDRSMAEPPKFSDKTDYLKPGIFSLPEKVEDCAVYHQFQRPASPLPSNASLKSDRSMAEPPKFSDKTGHLQPNLPEKVEDCAVYHQFQRPASPLPSNASLKSDRSMAEPPKFSDKTGHLQPSLSNNASLKSDRSMAEPPKFSDKAEHFKHSGRKKPVVQDQSECLSGDSDGFRCRKISEIFPIIHPHMRGTSPAEEQPSSCQPVDAILQSIKESHKTNMQKYGSLCEGISIQENKNNLNKIYTQLYIIEGEREGVNEEHEVVQIEKTKTECLQGTPINCNDIFQPKSYPSYERKDDKEKVKTVLTKGIAGIGKTVSVHKFILDWAKGEANQDVDFLFVLPFRELNLVKDNQYSLHRLLLDFHPELLELDTRVYDLCKVLFIFDGLDESRITLTFSHCETISDVTTTSSVSMLMSNLIKGELLPSALIWITSRPTAASQIPTHYISCVTEVQGFSDPQKEEYFRKRISDQHQATRIISHLRKARSLHIMCHIPVFCWITDTVLQNILKHDQSAEIPKTLTEMYIHFLIIQTVMKRQKYDERDGKDPKLLLQSEKDVILKLAELAFKALMNGDVLFYDEDLQECGIDVNKASEYSGICTEIFKKESVIFSRKVYCFVHLSFQEFFAALFVFFSYLNKNTDILKMFRIKKGRKKIKPQFDEVSLDAFLKVVVDEALKSDTGHLDLFLRFLHGISLESNQSLLQGLLTHVEDNNESMKKVIKNLRQSQKQNVKPERWINLSHCLIEMKDTSILEDIEAYLKAEGTFKKSLSPVHCSALANMLLMAEDVLEELNLKKYNTTSMEAQRRLVPAVRNCRKAILKGCNLTEQSCEIVASALQPENSPVRELDMSNNDLQDSGVKLISIGLKSSHCKLEILRLKGCKLTMQSCEVLASALLSDNSCLRELDLSNNDLQDSGVELLAAGLKSPHCKLEILSLAGCKLTDQSCETLASVLLSVNSCLRELDLSNNDLKDSRLEWLSAGLNSCKLEKLRLTSCNLTGQSCEMMASTLQSVHCLLKELDLSDNDLQDIGVEIFSAGLRSPYCILEILRMSTCNLTDRSCATVASVLQSAKCSLRELNLSKNDLQDSGVKMLSDGLKSPLCKLEILRLSGCFITEEGCSVLAAALTSNPSHLRELDLSCNHAGDLGGQMLTARLNDPTCKLEVLNLEHEGKFRITAGLRRCACELTLDLDTAHTNLSLSEGNKTVTYMEEKQSYPDHPERFECYPQVLCRESLSGRCSWEVEWSGKSEVYVSVSYKGIRRKGESNDYEFGSNEKSWRFVCSDNSFSAWHNNKRTKMRPPSSSSHSKRVWVYLDCPASTLSFCSVSDKNRLTHLHTFHSTFPEPLYAGFGLSSGSSVFLCQIETHPDGKNTNSCGNNM